MSGLVDRVKGWLFSEEEDDPEEMELAPAPVVRRKRPTLLSLHHASRQDEIHVRRLRSQDDARVCADCLKYRRPVVVNLKHLDEPIARRAFDFLSGVVYAIDGHIEEAGDGIFLLTSSSQSIATDHEAPHDEAPHDQEEPFWSEQG